VSTPPAERVRDPRAEAFVLPARPELTGGRRVGVLMSHGFTGSPASMRPWGEALAARGYGVHAPRLPGHGTTWQDMARTGWDDWRGELDRALDVLLAEHDVVAVAGLSMGGALALRLAADRPGDVASLVLVNPAVTSRDRRLVAVPLLRRVLASMPGIGNDIRARVEDGAEVDEVGYDRVPLAALHQMMTGWRALRGDLGRVAAPLLMFRSVTDHVVDPSSGAVITSGVGSAQVTERLLERSWHVATLDHDLPVLVEESAAFLAATCGVPPAVG